MYGNAPTAPLRTQVKRLTSPYSIDRQDSRDNSQPGVGESYTEDATTVDCYVYDASSTQEVVSVGEVSRGQLQGVALAEADIQEHDRLTYGGRRYEVVEPIRAIPSEDSAAIQQFPLERLDYER